MDDDEPDPEGLIGAVLASRYRIDARIGTGAMGSVYRANHIKLGRPFAIKVLRRSLLDDATTRRRFTREAELAGALHHPNIVSMVDVGETPDGLHYLVMEYAPGETLYDVIVRSAPLPGDRVIAIARQLCDGLEHAHDRGLIHRDFKPENVMVEPGGDRDRLKIVDFGIAILRDEAMSSSPERLTTAGIVLGTPHYMAPEQALGDPIDHRVDLFALGVMCFEMLTAWPPFDGDGVDVARANVALETPVMRVRAPGVTVDPLLEGFTRRLMAKSRDERPASASAARALLDLIERDRSAAAIELGIARRPAPEPKATIAVRTALAALRETPTLHSASPPPGVIARAPTPAREMATLRGPAPPPPAVLVRTPAGTPPGAALTVRAPDGLPPAWTLAARQALHAAATAPTVPLGAPLVPLGGPLGSSVGGPISMAPRRARTTEQLTHVRGGTVRLGLTGLVFAVATAITVVIGLIIALQLRH